MKKVLATVISIILILFVCPVGLFGVMAESDIWDGSVASGFASGAGTESDPYMIQTAAQLAYLAQSTNAGNTYEGKYIKLAKDIVLNSSDMFAKDANGNITGAAACKTPYQWTAIGNNINPFCGNFNGEGYTIAGIYINTLVGNQGVFGYCQNAILQNLGVLDGYVYAQNGVCVGGVVGGNYTSEYGGIAAIINCYNTCTVIGNTGVGGVVGATINPSGSATVINCYNTGAISSEFDGGGVVGTNYGGSETATSTVVNCYNTGTVNGVNATPGGVVGTNVASSGTTATVTNCYYLDTCVSGGNAYGTALTDTQMREQASFVGFDFDTVWTMAGDPDYPYPELQVLQPAITYSGTCGENLTWLLDTKTGELTISGTGAMTEWSSNSSVPWYSYYSSIKSVTIGNGVTSIGNNAFYGCTRLTSITVVPGNPVYHSAGNCLIETGSKTLIQGCNTSVIPTDGSVTSIGSYAFRDCTGLTSITIPDSVTFIDALAFDNCTGLTRITVAPGNPVYHSAGNCLIETGSKKLITGCKASVIPADGNVTSIGDHAFYGCVGLTSITIPDSVTFIDAWAFDNCTGLTSITVTSGNPAYHSAGDCLIETGSKKLITGCKASVIPADGSVTSIGDHAFYGCTGLTSITIPDSVTSIDDAAFQSCAGLISITIPDSVTSIGNDAFSGCTIKELIIANGSESVTPDMVVCRSTLETVTIPDSVTSIEMYAFSDCTELTDIIIPDSVTLIAYGAFYGCTGLTSIIIPDSITSIGGEVFYGCTGLTSITIPDSVTSISYGAFRNCTGLTGITIPDSVTSIGMHAFSGCKGLTSVTVPDNVTTIDYQAFYNCTGLTSITISGSVTSINDSVFNGCTGLTSVTIPNSVTYIGMGAFRDCTKLTSVTIGNSVTFIDYAAFYGCRKLTSITIPDSVISIGNYAFYNCTGLTSVTIGNGVTSIDHHAFHNCTGLTSITIPDSVTSIGEGAFRMCSGLTSITIPDSVTSIGNEAFDGCKKLTSVSIPNGITSIGWYTFNACSALTSVTIPDSVTSIGQQAFYDCTGLTSVTIGNSVTSIGYQAFYGCTKLTSITIPDSVTIIDSYAFGNTAWEKNQPVGLLYAGKVAYKYKGTCPASVTIQDGTLGIAGSAFANCKGLTNINIPGSVTFISNSAFSGCTGLTIRCPVASYAATYAAENGIPAELVTALRILTNPTKRIYPVNGILKTDGLTLEAILDDGSAVTISSDYTVGAYDFSTAGIKTVPVSFIGFTVSFTVTVDASIVLPESDHPYANNADETWTYTHPTPADSLLVTFSADTQTESRYDFIYLYDGSGNQVGSYTGTALAGRTVEIPGNKFSIRLTSDSVVTRYGFAVTDITAVGGTAPLSHDLDGDGKIDAGDLVFCRQALLSGGEADINGDGVTDVLDLIRLKKVLVERVITVADFDGDGVITGEDIAAMQQVLATDGEADINGDGKTDILDLIFLKKTFAA